MTGGGWQATAFTSQAIAGNMVRSWRRMYLYNTAGHFGAGGGTLWTPATGI